MKFAFASRHAPTDRQHVLAAQLGIQLGESKDVDVFEGDFGELEGYGAVVVHPVAAFRAAAAGLLVGVFRNANRAPEGAPPRFEAQELWVFAASRRLTTQREILKACGLSEEEDGGLLHDGAVHPWSQEGGR